MRIFNAFTTLVLLTCFSLAQRAPVPALNTPTGDDVSMSYMLVVKDRSLDVGNGGDFNSTHYVTQHLGISAEAEAMQLNRWLLREYAVRVGPTYRFNVGANTQPFVRILAGYSGVASNYFGPNHDSRQQQWGGSLLVGAGTDIRVKGRLFARVATDVVDDWDAKTRFARGTIGFAYHFGDKGRR